MKKYFKNISLIFIAAFFLMNTGLSFAQQDRIIEMKGLKKVERKTKEEFKSQVSQKNLLGLKRKSHKMNISNE